MVYRLPHDLQNDLTWFWCEAEAALGVCSNAGAIENTLLLKSMPEVERDPDAISPMHRWRLATPEQRIEMRRERWDREDQIIRDIWQTMCVHDDAVGKPSEPDGNAETRGRVARVAAALHRLVRGDRGPLHQRVLYCVYGQYDRNVDDVTPVLQYTDEVIQRTTCTGLTWREAMQELTRDGAARTLSDIRRNANRLLENASKAFLESNDSEVGVIKHSHRARKERRRVALYERLGEM
jgi:hypothetical protein